MKSGMELKKEIMKATGLKASKLSCKLDKYSMGQSYDIYVKVLFPLSKIKEIAKQCEKIRYDEYVGEILSGGNTFVNVRYGNVQLTKQATAAIESAVNAFGFTGNDTSRGRCYHVATYMAENKMIAGFETQSDYAHLVHLLPNGETLKTLGMGW